MNNNNVLKLQAKMIASLALRTADQLDALARNGLTVLIENAIWKSDLVLPELPGGWMAQYIGKMEAGGRGKVVLLPNHTHARKCWLEGQIATGVKAGLTEEQSKIWATSKIPHKHDVLELLVKVLNDDKLKEGYLSWNIRFTIDEFHHWSARTGIIDHLNPLRRKTLVRLLREQLDPESVRGRKKKSDEDDSEKDVEMPYSPALAALENGLEVPGETESIPDEVPEEGLVVNVGESSFGATEEDLSAIGHQTETEPTVQ